MSGGVFHYARAAIDRVQHMPEQTKVVGDALSISAVLGAIAGVLPSIAALVTIIWTGIRIFETPTIQGLIKRYKERNQK